VRERVCVRGSQGIGLWTRNVHVHLPNVVHLSNIEGRAAVAFAVLLLNPHMRQRCLLRKHTQRHILPPHIRHGICIRSARACPSPPPPTPPPLDPGGLIRGVGALGTHVNEEVEKVGVRRAVESEFSEIMRHSPQRRVVNQLPALSQQHYVVE